MLAVGRQTKHLAEDLDLTFNARVDPPRAFAGLGNAQWRLGGLDRV